MFNCEYCFKGFDTQKGYRHHIITTHPSQEKNLEVCSFPCPKCLKTYGSKQCLQRHLRDHKKEEGLALEQLRDRNRILEEDTKRIAYKFLATMFSAGAALRPVFTPLKSKVHADDFTFEMFSDVIDVFYKEKSVPRFIRHAYFNPRYPERQCFRFERGHEDGTEYRAFRFDLSHDGSQWRWMLKNFRTRFWISRLRPFYTC